MREKIIIRRVVSLTLALSFLTMSSSGILLFIAPKGSVATLTHWSVLGLDKTAISHIHITTLFLFLSVALWHIYNNWHALTAYLKNSAHQFILFTKEFIIALAITLLFISGAIIGFEPFKSVIRLNDTLKAYWEQQAENQSGSAKERSPYYLGQQSLSHLATVYRFDLQKALDYLHQKGIKAKETTQIKEAAHALNMTPRELLEILIRLDS